MAHVVHCGEISSFGHTQQQNKTKQNKTKQNNNKSMLWGPKKWSQQESHNAGADYIQINTFLIFMAQIHCLPKTA
jgi:hypothetical protein